MSKICRCDGTEHTHLSMPDPCPHVSRLEMIAAKLAGGERLEQALNCVECEIERLQREYDHAVEVEHDLFKAGAIEEAIIGLIGG